jgi:hypothetical protein
LATNKKRGAMTFTKVFLRIKWPKVAIFPGEKKLNRLHLDHRVLHVTNIYIYIEVWKNPKLGFFPLTYSQILLSCLVNDSQSTYLTKLKQKTPWQNSKWLSSLVWVVGISFAKHQNRDTKKKTCACH